MGTDEKLLIRGGRLLDPASGRDEPADLLIEDGKIAGSAAPASIEPNGHRVIDAEGKIVCPGFIDIHVHLREPGYEYRETVATGCRSAVAGGVTSVACMANTRPVNDNAAVTRLILDRARETGLANVFPIGAVSVGLQGKELARAGEMHEAGCVALSDDGMPIMNSGLMRRALEYSSMFGIPVIAHEEDCALTEGGVMNEGLTSVRLGLGGMPAAAESGMVARDIELLRLTGGHLHIAHVSTAESVAMIREALRQGLNISSEVTPHHFMLDETAVEGYDTRAKMNPPLRTGRDIEALREGLADGTFDCIATDHAPHHRDEKALEMDSAPFGIVGLETLLPLSLSLVRDGVIGLNRMIELVTTGPARAIGVDRGTLAVGAPADVTVFDPEREWRFSAIEASSAASNSPFDGWKMTGRAEYTVVGGKVAWDSEQEGAGQ